MSLSFTEMKAIALGAFGAEWQNPLARALDTNPRTVRRWVEAQSCPDWLTRERLAEALGIAPGTPVDTTPADEWIIGEGTASEPSRQYVIHTIPPRFIARAVVPAAWDENDDPILPASDGSDGEPAYSPLAPLTFADNFVFLTDVVWLDEAPAFEVARRALSQAADLFAIVDSDGGIEAPKPKKP